MATVLGECTTEGQRSVVCLLWTKELNAKDIRKEIIPVYSGKCEFHQFCPLKTTLVANVSLMTKRFGTEVRKWLRQQSDNLYAAGFDALIKRWDRYMNVDGGYVKK
jgi:hypothetical protein